MNPKIAIAVLAVAVLLFALAIGSGLRGGFGNQNNATPGPLGGLLGSILVKPLDLQTVKATPSSCVVGQQVVIPPGGTCLLTVPKAGPATRRLTYGQGTMSVTFKPADGSFTPRTASMPGETHSFDVIAAGGELDISCQSLGQFCVLRGAV